MSAHARLGPSNHRWPNCPGSVREEAQYKDVSGEAAIDGTGSHELLELCLNNGVMADSYLDQIICVNHEDMPGGWFIHQDRIDRVNMCLDYVDRRHKELAAQFPDATITVVAEGRSNPGGMFGRDDWWGTVDITITVRHAHTGECLFIEVIDYKDGRGWVHVPGNTQLIAYMGGRMRPFIAAGPDQVRRFDAGKVGACRITIVQPKTNPVVRYEDMLPSKVVEAVEVLGWAAHLTDDPDATLNPGKHCQWCKASPKRGGHCTSQADKDLATVENMSTDVIATDGGGSLFEQMGQLTADPASLTVEQLSELLDARPGLNAAFDRIGEEIEKRIDEGTPVPGYALMPGSGKRAYNEDEEAIAKALKGRKMKKDEIYPAKLITPAALENSNCLTPAQLAPFLKKYVTTVASKTLSLKQVARETQDVTVEEMFADVGKNVVATVAQTPTGVVECETSEGAPVSFM